MGGCSFPAFFITDWRSAWQCVRSAPEVAAGRHFYRVKSVATAGSGFASVSFVSNP
jgi:hypothetical protein